MIRTSNRSSSAFPVLAAVALLAGSWAGVASAGDPREDNAAKKAPRGSLVGMWHGTVQPNQCDDGGWTGEALDFCLDISQDRGGNVTGSLDWWTFSDCSAKSFTGTKKAGKVNLQTPVVDGDQFTLDLKLERGTTLKGTATWNTCPAWPLELTRR